MDTKVVDNKGRIALGVEFAGKTVIVERELGQIIIKPAVVIPEYELWLFKNPEARDAVFAGLEEARQGKFCKNPPDIDADEQLAEQLDD